jgi:large subunit ribosomal protein L29
MIMNFDDLKAKTQDELAKTLLDLKKQQMEMRFKHAGGQLEKSHELRAIRRNVARVQTAMNMPADAKTSPKKEKAAKPAAKKTTTKKATKAA